MDNKLYKHIDNMIAVYTACKKNKRPMVMVDKDMDAMSALKAENERLRKALVYVEKACLCTRFSDRKMKKGFDYGETHPKMGKCEGGARFLTPVDKAKQALGGE